MSTSYEAKYRNRTWNEPMSTHFHVLPNWVVTNNPGLLKASLGAPQMNTKNWFLWHDALSSRRILAKLQEKEPPPFSGSKSKWRNLICPLCMFFDPEDGFSTFLRNVSVLLPEYTSSHHGKWDSSQSRPWDTETSRKPIGKELSSQYWKEGPRAVAVVFVGCVPFRIGAHSACRLYPAQHVVAFHMDPWNMYLVTPSLPAAKTARTCCRSAGTGAEKLWVLTAKGGEQDPPRSEAHRRSPRRLLGLKHRGTDVLWESGSASCGDVHHHGISRKLLNYVFKVKWEAKLPDRRSC
jgi:hypothetical protein